MPPSLVCSRLPLASNCIPRRIGMRRCRMCAIADDVFPGCSGVAECIGAKPETAVHIGKRAILPIAGDEHDGWTCRVRGERAVYTTLRAGVDRWRRNPEARPAAALVG